MGECEKRGKRRIRYNRRQSSVSIKQWSVIPRLVNGACLVLGGSCCLGFAFRPVHKVLGKDAEVHQKSNGAASQPAEIHQDVSAVTPPCFCWLACLFSAAWLVHDNGQNVHCVSKTGKQEEEHAQSFSCLAPPVEDELRHSGRNVEDRANVAKHLTQCVELEGLIAVRRGSFATGRSFAKKPAGNSSAAHHEDHNRVPHDSLQCRRWWLRSGWRLKKMRHCRREAGPVRAASAMVVWSAEKGSVFVNMRRGRGCRGSVAVCLGEGWSRLVAPRESAVVEQLAEQYNVGNGVVYRQDDHCGKHSLQYSAEYIEYISQQPNDDELNGEGIGAASLEVLYDLRREHDNPTSDGY